MRDDSYLICSIAFVDGSISLAFGTPTRTVAIQNALNYGRLVYVVAVPNYTDIYIY